MGLDLSEQELAALEARTEGWIAGLQLAALSLQGRTDASTRIESFTGSHRYVLDYLLEEVLHDFDVLVALEQDQVVGFIAANPERIAHFFVRIDRQGRGIGSRLLDWAKERAADHLELSVHECNTRAQRYYEQRGFEQTGEDKGASWRMRKLRYTWRPD